MNTTEKRTLKIPDNIAVRFPDGIEASFSMYLTCDETGLNMELSVNRLPGWPADAPEIPATLYDGAAAFGMVSPRPMTRD